MVHETTPNMLFIRLSTYVVIHLTTDEELFLIKLFEYNQCEYSHLCINSSYYYNHVFACMYRHLKREAASRVFPSGKYIMGLLFS